MGAIHTPAQERKVNGITLHWSENYQKWAAPMSEKAQMDLVLDEDSGQLMPVKRGAVVVQQFRQVTLPDGTVIMEMRVYGDELEEQQMQIQKAAQSAQLEKNLFKLQTWKTVRNTQPLIVVGLVATIGTFFWNVCAALSSTAGLVGINTGLALAEIAYFAIWGVAALLAVLALKFLIPIIFRNSAPMNADVLPVEPMRQQSSGGDTVNVVINKAGGNLTAQDFVTNRGF